MGLVMHMLRADSGSTHCEHWQNSDDRHESAEKNRKRKTNISSQYVNDIAWMSADWKHVLERQVREFQERLYEMFGFIISVFDFQISM